MLNRVAKILEQPACDHCLGRQFGQLLSGFSNAERGKLLRNALALAVDSNEFPAESLAKIDMNNFHQCRFRFNKDLAKKDFEKRVCAICGDFFEHIDKMVENAAKKLSKQEFDTFLIGTKISTDLLQREEQLWEKIGIEFCEPIRAEINREVGRRLENALGKKADLKKPDIAVLLDLEQNKISLQINSLYVFGYYQKLVRGIPQSKWGTPHKYKTSVEEIIGKPLLKAADGFDIKLHGSGREDIDAICTAWRPFVLEVLKPKKRKIDLEKAKRLVNGRKVRVSGLKIVELDVVQKVKEAKPDKSYKAVVKLEKEIKKTDLAKLKQLIGIINQRTPQRVLHRRGNLLRKREVKELKTKWLGKKKFELIVKTEAGLYIKELISSDDGRTKPSVSEVLGQKAICEKLDVIKIEQIKI
ncbi:MAG: tRNA pseudouridine(54/55) synthase Pus10 [Candidatus Aenigmatarchaeota archaeon]